jgi:hypothetical protein
MTDMKNTIAKAIGFTVYFLGILVLVIGVWVVDRVQSYGLSIGLDGPGWPLLIIPILFSVALCEVGRTFAGDSRRGLLWIEIVAIGLVLFLSMMSASSTAWPAG